MLRARCALLRMKEPTGANCEHFVRWRAERVSFNMGCLLCGLCAVPGVRCAARYNAPRAAVRRRGVLEPHTGSNFLQSRNERLYSYSKEENNNYCGRLCPLR